MTERIEDMIRAADANVERQREKEETKEPVEHDSDDDANAQLWEAIANRPPIDPEERMRRARVPVTISPAASLAHVRAWVASDAVAMTFQSLGQYRAALLRILARATQDASLATEGAKE